MEADNLNRFGANFRYWNGVRFPRPAAAPLVSSDVLVETFEEGELITRYMETETPGRYNKKLAGEGGGGRGAVCVCEGGGSPCEGRE